MGLSPWTEGQVINASLVSSLLSWVIISRVRIENPPVLMNLQISRGSGVLALGIFSSTAFGSFSDRVGIAQGISTGGSLVASSGVCSIFSAGSSDILGIFPEPRDG